MKEERICFGCAKKYEDDDTQIEHLCSKCKKKRSQKQTNLTDFAKVMAFANRMENSRFFGLVKVGTVLFTMAFFTPFILLLVMI